MEIDPGKTKPGFDLLYNRSQNMIVAGVSKAQGATLKTGKLFYWINCGFMI